MIALNKYLYLEYEANLYDIDFFTIVAYIDTIETTHEFLMTNFTFFCS